MSGALTCSDPFAELGELRSRFDRMLDEWLDGRERAWTPAIDVVRDDGHLVVHAGLPGIKSEEVEIDVEDDILNILTISGVREERRNEKDEHCVRRERRHGSFSRSMALLGGVDARKVKASTRYGVNRCDDPAPRGGQGAGQDHPDRRFMTPRLRARPGV